MAAYEVLSSMMKGSRGHCLRVSEIPSRQQMLQGRVPHTTRAEAAQLVGGCQSLHSSKSNQLNLWKKNLFGTIKK